MLRPPFFVAVDCRCVGHSGSIQHLDWTLPVPSPAAVVGQMLLMSTDNAAEILYWNPLTGRRVNSNQRDAPM